MREKKSNFRGAVMSDLENQKSRNTGKGSGYLNLPRGFKAYTAEVDIKKVKLDFIPYIVSDLHHPCQDAIARTGNNLWWYLPFKVHRDVGSDRKNNKAICLASLGHKCPICEYQRKLFDQGAPKTETVPLYPQSRALYVVIPIGQKDYDEVPMVWDMSTKMYHDLLVELLQEDDSHEIFFDLEAGETQEISFKWDTIGEKGKPFPEARNINFLPREPYDEKILESVPDLTSILTVLSYEELSNKFFEIDEPDAGKLEEKEPDAPIETGRTRKSIQPDAEKEPPRRRAPKEEKKEEPVPPTWDELTRIDRPNLATLIDEYQIPLDINNFDDTDEGDVEIRKSIAEALEIEVPQPRSARAERTAEKETKKVEDIKPTRGSYTPPVRGSRPGEEKAEKPAGMSRASRSAEPDKKDACPHGHVFGKDTERFDDCDTCKVFDDCLDAKRNKK